MFLLAFEVDCEPEVVNKKARSHMAHVLLRLRPNVYRLQCFCLESLGDLSLRFQALPCDLMAGNVGLR